MLTGKISSDATVNNAQWIGVTTANVPAWRADSGTRAAEIVQVTDAVKAILSTTPIDVVTTLEERVVFNVPREVRVARAPAEQH